ncbi:RNA-binding S4 domain-containing protein [Pelagibacterium montanilacus]|uniref:RNA-binding S4 domain-containing protein n=1 Tax=Pelagibacterium montanilacus TaxID=2185280 RepID=UPI000F8C903D|nr:RNA-binding S4 domain-containing protein [Pelagibacterium montanilacus]
MQGTEPRQRLDKWLWYARVARSRSLAQKLVASGAVRVNGQRCVAPDRRIAPGDGLTIAIAGRIRVLRVRDPGARRGPATEARLLYEDLSPDPAPPQ